MAPPTTPSEVAAELMRRHPGVEAHKIEGQTAELTVPAGMIRDVVKSVDELLPHALPESMFGVDLQDDRYQLIYYFWSHDIRVLVQLRVELEGEEPEIDSVCDIFPGLEWHERETHEMFGIGFRGHPDLRPLLLPDELVGKYPLRKSFQPDRRRLAESGLPQPRPRRQEANKE